MEEQMKELVAKQLKGVEKEYFLKHGDIIPNVHSRRLKGDYKNKVYEQAIKEGKTWQEILQFDLSEW